MKEGLITTAVVILLFLGAVVASTFVEDNTVPQRRDRWISYCTGSEFTAKQCDVLYSIKTREER